MTNHPICSFYKLPRITRQERLAQINKAVNLDNHPFEKHGRVLSQALYAIQGWNGTDCVRVKITRADQREIAYAIKELAKLDWTARVEKIEEGINTVEHYLYIC
jgi:hypothetical protein